MPAVLISHGFNASPDVNWFPWLRDELTADGYTVAVPALPEPAAPDPEAWRKTLEAALPAEPADTVLVGHSLGGVALLRLLQNHDTAGQGPFRGLVLVASMAKDLGFPNLTGFYCPGFHWPRIRAAVGGARVLHAVDDPLTGPVLMDHLRIFTTALGAEVTLLPEGGHFPSHGASRTRLPEAARLIRALMAPPDRG